MSGVNWGLLSFLLFYPTFTCIKYPFSFTSGHNLWTLPFCIWIRSTNQLFQQTKIFYVAGRESTKLIYWHVFFKKMLGEFWWFSGNGFVIVCPLDVNALVERFGGQWHWKLIGFLCGLSSKCEMNFLRFGLIYFYFRNFH